jgi:hypothetical protein
MSFLLFSLKQLRIVSYGLLVCTMDLWSAFSCFHFHYKQASASASVGLSWEHFKDISDVTIISSRKGNIMNPLNWGVSSFEHLIKCQQWNNLGYFTFFLFFLLNYYYYYFFIYNKIAFMTN